MPKRKIAFVVQRSGREVNGGAEYHCFLVAKLMQKEWDIDILTTCALDYMSWENHYPEGDEIIEGITIRRFGVDTPRDVEAFNHYSDEVLPSASTATIEASEKWMKLQGPMSSGLLEYIREKRDDYEQFFFFTYLYASTYYGLQLVADKSVLIPTAHDEPPIYLPIWKEWFKLPRYFIFNTIEEKRFLEELFPDIAFEGEITGIGVTMPQEASEIRFRQRFDIYLPYLLYVGRIDPSKGSNELFEHFMRFKKEHPVPLRLVLAGKAVMDLPEHQDIVHLGFIDEQTKFDAISGSEFLVNSSRYESLSMVLLESWSLNKAVLVNGESDVMVGQCKRSNGGLWYRDYKTFEINTLFLLSNAYRMTGMKEFVETHYGWETIKRKYHDILERTVTKEEGTE